MINKDNVSTGLSILTGSFALANIYEILSIIILIISIVNILFNMSFKIYDKIKNKKYEEIPADINEATENLKKLEKKEGKENE